MRYEISGNSSMRGGANIQISDVGDLYLISGEMSVEFGKKVFGKWVSVGSKSKSFSIRIPKEKLSEQFIEHSPGFVFDGISFSRSGDHSFDFASGQASGSFEYTCDGADPVDVTKVNVSAVGISATLQRV